MRMRGRDEGARENRRRRLAVGAVTVVGLAALGFGAGPVVGGMLNERPTPEAAGPVATVVATQAQVSASSSGQASAGGASGATSSAAAGGSGSGSGSGSGTASAKKKSKKKSKTKVVYKNKPAVLDSRISTEPIVTEEGKGSFVGLKCPKDFKAVAGGVLSRYINLVVSSSSPNNPVSEKFTPNTWWLAVTNINVDGQGGSLSWRGVVSCMKPIKLKHD